MSDDIIKRLRADLETGNTASGRVFSASPDNIATLLDRLDAAERENERLREAIGEAYGYLWCVNNEPGTPHQYPPERAAYKARILLRDTMTKEQRGEFIVRVMAHVRAAMAAEQPERQE